MQHNIFAVVALALACALGAHHANAEELSKSGKPLTAQQSRMKACNADAKSQALKGDERKAFMSTCLKGNKATAAQEPVIAKQETPRQAQRKACGAEAKSQSLKGEERKEFVKECMKRPPAAEQND